METYAVVWIWMALVAIQALAAHELLYHNIYVYNMPTYTLRDLNAGH